jgi:hypothetical protein
MSLLLRPLLCCLALAFAVVAAPVATAAAAKPAYTNVLVVAGGANMFIKEHAEDAICAMLVKHGARCTTGMSLWGNRTRLDRELVEPYVQRDGYDAIYFVSAGMYDPGAATNRDFYFDSSTTLDQYYTMAFAAALLPGKVVDSRTEILMTLFDTATRKPVFNDYFETRSSADSDKVIKQAVKKTESGLRKAGLLGK